MHPAFTISAAGSTPTGCCGLDTSDQVGCSKGLGEETNGSGPQRAVADAVLREGRDKNKRRLVTLGPHMRKKFQPAHAGHLHISNDTGRIVQVGRLQELLGRRKCMDQVSMRAEKIVDRGADGCIVVND
jgi:hypothetical protein